MPHLRPLPYLGGWNAYLALDMYEHSYHIDFGTKAGSYVEAFMEAIRRTYADRLLAKAVGLTLA